MILKLIGSIFIVAGCGGYGFFLAATYRLETNTLRQLLKAIEYFSYELSYRRTVLPQLCRQAGDQCTGVIRQFFLALGDELDRQVVADVHRCVQFVIQRTEHMPPIVKQELTELGHTLGIFDLDGQLQALTVRKISIQGILAAREAEQSTRVRSYQTLALCAGAALAILLI